MNVITGPRGSGKTTEAIKLANEEGAYLAVHTQDRATHLYHSDNHPDIDRFPITYRELYEKKAVRPDLTVVIDDLDIFLRSEVYPNITGVAMTADETSALEAREQ